MKHLFFAFFCVLACMTSLSGVEGEFVGGTLKLTGAPPAGKVISRHYRADLGMTELRLENGMRVLIKTGSFGDSQVWLRLFAHGGYGAVDADSWASGKMAGFVAWESGFGGLSRSSIREYLEGRGIDMRLKLKREERYVEAQTDVSGLKSVFRLMHLVFQKGEPKKEILDHVVRHTEQVKELRKQSSQQVLVDRVAKLNTGNHYSFKHVGTTVSKTLDLQFMSQFYQESFGNPGDFTLVVVGDVDVARIEELIRDYLANIPVRAFFPYKVGAPKSTFPTAPIREEVRAGQGKSYITRLTFPLGGLEGPDDVVALESYCQILQERLKAGLQKRGSTGVGIRVGYEFPNYPDRNQVWLSIQVHGSNKKVAGLADWVVDEVVQLQSEGVGAEAMERAAGVLDASESFWSRHQEYWRALLVNAAYWDWDPKAIQTTESRIREIQVDQVNALLQNKLRTDRYTVVNLKPEK